MEIIDTWTEESGVGEDIKFRSVSSSDEDVTVQFFDGNTWVPYRMDSTVKSIITRLYKEINSLESKLEYAHYEPDEI